MNRFFSVFLVAAFSCTYAFSQSTNFTGTGSEIIGFTNLSFSGEAGGDAAALSSLQSFDSANTAYQGGAGSDLSGNGGALDAKGGSGLRLMSVSSSMVVGSEAIGADAGSVVQENPTQPANAAGGDGLGVGVAVLSPFAPAVSLEVAGLLAQGGHGGAITADSGSFENVADGGSGISVLQGKVQLEVTDSTLYGGDAGAISSGGTESSSAKGGSGVSIRKAPFTKFNSAVFSDLEAFGGKGGSITALGAADASGGHGVGVTQPSGLVVVESGTYVGGVGGSASGASSALANGGDGFRYVGKATENNSLVVSNGTFQGAAGGTVSGIAGSATASGGNGLYVENATVEIHGGDFSGGAAGNANGVEGEQGVGLRATNSTVTLRGGSFDRVWLSGDGINTVTNTGGAIGGLLLSGTGTYNLYMETAATITDGIVQTGGTATFTKWADHHFTDTTIYGGTMNFNNQGFNLESGNSFSMLDATAAANFNDGFTAQGGSAITTTFDGVNHSTITGSDLQFEAGARWTILGSNTIANGDTITMASATSSLVNNLDDADIEYLGGSWAAGITVDAVANELIGTYGYVALDNALGLDPNDGGFGTAMAQFSGTNGTDFANSGDSEYTGIKALPSQAAADRVMREQYNGNQMVGSMIQLQGLFSDQITDRTRSYLRRQGWAGSASYSPQGAMGPDLWEKTMDGLSENLPSWDVSKTARNIDDSLPRLDRQGAHEAPARQPYAHQPKAEKINVEIPSTWQAWGRGYGSYFNQDDAGDVVGYDATIGGGVFGVDKRFDHMLLGLGGGYAHTALNGNGGGEDEADTVYGTAYGAVDWEKVFLEFNANYAFNDVEQAGSPIAGEYTADYDSSTLGMYVGGGMGVPVFGSVLLTPEASLLATYYLRDGYTETAQATDGTYPDLVWDDYDQWSYLGSLGATLSMIGQIDSFNLEMQFRPEIRAHWLHEFNAEMDDDAYLMEGYTDPVAVVLQAREEDLAKLGTGVRFSKWGSDTLEFGLDFDVVLGQDYEAYIGSAKLLHRF